MLPEQSAIVDNPGDNPVVCDTDRTMPSARPRGTEPDAGYLRLREAILQGQFLPNERLVEADLTGKFQLGRAAVRTALARLEQDGLVEREPFRGARVRSISLAEAIEVLEARAVLEGLSARHAAHYASADDVAALRATLARMRSHYDAGDLLGVSAGSTDMHRQLLEIARHQTAARLIDGLRAQNVRHQFRTILVPGRASQSLEEHCAIIDAIAAGDAERAEEMARHHVQNIADALRQASAAPLDQHAAAI
jgi:DNA-binding GntR family transcriptional regulator